MTQTINYQHIFEQEVNHVARESAGLSERFFDLPDDHRMLVESLIDAAYSQAISDALNPELLADTADLAGEMGTQLYNFANMVQTYLGTQGDGRED